MSTTATFEQRATAAGASLRAAFYEGDPMTAPTTFRPPTVEQPTGGHSRGAKLLAAAAAVAALAAGTAVVLASTGDERALPPAVQPEPTVLTGLRDVPDFPIGLTVPEGLVEIDEDAGSRAFRLESGIPGSVLITGLRSLNGRPVGELPADVTAAFASRPDVTVTDRRTANVAGRAAQGFTLTVTPGTRPYDLWCPVEETLCFKLDPKRTAEVLVVPTSAEPLWIAIEFTPGTAQDVRALAAELLAELSLP